MSRPFALLGSGEFEPWTVEVDAWLLDIADGDGSVLVVPTASAGEGAAVFDRWSAKGLAHYEASGVPAQVLPIKTRADSDRKELARMITDASVVYFSGGNPWYLAEALRGSMCWGEIVRRHGAGLAYAGCSAGVACLTEVTFDSASDDLREVFKPGLGYLRPGVVIGPHWDVLDSWAPGTRDALGSTVPEGGVLVGIDEDTALLGDGVSWQVAGRQGVHVRADDGWTHAGPGDALDLPLMP